MGTGTEFCVRGIFGWARLCPPYESRGCCIANARQKVLEKIDERRDQAIGFLQKMIAIPSVTGDEAKIQKFLADYLAAVGLDVDTWETNRS